jgi:Lipocalin-like domain
MRGRAIMKYWFSRLIWVLALAGVPWVGLAGCGDDGAEVAPELFGTWDAVSIEAEGMSTSCPGEIELSDTSSVSCGTEASTFNADGTFVEVQTTDELGDPFDWRIEGTWSTEGSTLTLTYRQEGPDADNLEPIDPPETVSASWSVSGNTLTTSIQFGLVTVTGTAEKR